MSNWTYLPCDDCCSHYEYPELFEFGNADEDEDVFDLAWDDMRKRGYRVVRFDGLADSSDLERLGALLVRSDMLDILNHDRLVNSGLKPDKLLNEIIESPTSEAIFERMDAASVAMMVLGGRIVQ